ncbi:MAG: sterol desaturase family protein [Boseongicola sp.]|nr:MAG: sterol desaturase family protein [Boseongicola sp.]
MQSLIDNEPVLRLGVFLGILAVMAIWEVAAPRRRVEIPRLLRWSNNLALVALDGLLVRLVFPVAAVGFALMVEDAGWGVLNWVRVPGWLAVLVAVLVLDLVIYWQHVVFHAVPVLWRLHRMHHADLEFDVTTGLRFHPLEILLSMVIKLAAIAVLGAPAIAVLIFEVVLNGSAMFNHSNVRLPARVDAWLRLVIVTPDMHRVHHSVVRVETDSNFGFNVPWWDRIFGTYRGQPDAGHEGMVIGLERFRTRRDLWLDRMLRQPFQGSARGRDSDEKR